MHRFLLLILLLLLPFSALTEMPGHRLAQLDIIDQRDERIQHERYYYKGMYFRIAGCRPASIANALVSLLGTPDTPTPELLVELRNGLRFDRTDKASSIDPAQLPPHLQNPRSSATELRRLLSPVTAVSILSDEMLALEPAELLGQFLKDEDAHPLLIHKFYFTDHWPWLIRTAAALCQAGHPDARIALCSVGVGNADTDAPFRMGSGGHYATLFFQADEFYRDGAFYLLDSYPRALTGEVHGYREYYAARYHFAERPRSVFSTTFAPQRISNTVVRFSLVPKELESLRAAAADHDSLLTEFFSRIILYSDPFCMVYIP